MFYEEGVCEVKKVRMIDEPEVWHEKNRDFWIYNPKHLGIGKIIRLISSFTYFLILFR